ncbi:MAG: nitroreductase family protein [Firmicutes bacterium]|nr:nitroreductase family protein [Bacillota bacterium]
MNIIEGIQSRRSVRRFTDTPITDDALRIILEAGMSGPSCVNSRDWSFLVTRERDILGKMADANGRPAEPLRNAALGILVLGDLERAFPPAKEYWIIDGAISAENMILAAWGLGIGSVWLGTWPQNDRMEKLRKIFSLPETTVPHSIIAFGYPDEKPEAKGFYEENRVHIDKW